MNEEVLIVIPARSNSKRIKNKNIKKFLKKPIILYSIENALKSKITSLIHISTDSENIRKLIQKKTSIKIDFLRPKYLATDKTPIIDVVRYAFNKYKSKGCKIKYVILLTACSPLLDEKDLIRGLKIAKQNRTNYPVLGITEFPSPIEWAFKKNNNNSIQFLTNDFKKNSQKFTNKYYDTGTIAIFKSDVLEKSSANRFFKKFIPMILPRYKAVDIDTKEDWKFAEIIYSGLN